MEKLEQIKELFKQLTMSEQQKVMLELKKIQKGYNVTLKREDMLCPHCGSGAIIKHSKYKDTQRFKCKECNRTFLPTTGTYIHNIKKKEIYRIL